MGPPLRTAQERCSHIMDFRPLAIWLTLSVVPLSGGCGHRLTASDYDDSCAVNSDCVTLKFGDACSPCDNTFEAVSADELDAYEEDQARLTLECQQSVRLPDPRECDGSASGPVCQSNRCVVAEDRRPCPRNTSCFGTDD